MRKLDAFCEQNSRTRGGHFYSVECANGKSKKVIGVTPFCGFLRRIIVAARGS
jgi:hypothetical protein